MSNQKNIFEEKMKEAFDGYEADLDIAAFDKFTKSLDSVAADPFILKSVWSKWFSGSIISGSAVILAVVVASVVLWNSNDVEKLQSSNDQSIGILEEDKYKKPISNDEISNDEIVYTETQNILAETESKTQDKIVLEEVSTKVKTNEKTDIFNDVEIKNVQNQIYTRVQNGSVLSNGDLLENNESDHWRKPTSLNEETKNIGLDKALDDIVTEDKNDLLGNAVSASTEGNSKSSIILEEEFKEISSQSVLNIPTKKEASSFLKIEALASDLSLLKIERTEAVKRELAVTVMPVKVYSKSFDKFYLGLDYTKAFGFYDPNFSVYFGKVSRSINTLQAKIGYQHNSRTALELVYIPINHDYDLIQSYNGTVPNPEDYVLNQPKLSSNVFLFRILNCINLFRNKILLKPQIGIALGILNKVGETDQYNGELTYPYATVVNVEYSGTNSVIGGRYYPLIDTGMGLEFNLYKAFSINFSANYLYGTRAIYSHNLNYIVDEIKEENYQLEHSGSTLLLSMGVKYQFK